MGFGQPSGRPIINITFKSFPFPPNPAFSSGDICLVIIAAYTEHPDIPVGEKEKEKLSFKGRKVRSVLAGEVEIRK